MANGRGREHIGRGQTEGRWMIMIQSVGVYFLFFMTSDWTGSGSGQVWLDGNEWLMLIIDWLLIGLDWIGWPTGFLFHGQSVFSRWWVWGCGPSAAASLPSPCGGWRRRPTLPGGGGRGAFFLSFRFCLRLLCVCVFLVYLTCFQQKKNGSLLLVLVCKFFPLNCSASEHFCLSVLAHWRCAKTSNSNTPLNNHLNHK